MWPSSISTSITETARSTSSIPGLTFCSSASTNPPETIFPGTGYADETGVGPGKGYSVNIPMPVGATDDDYKAAFTRKIIPVVDEFEPEFLLVDVGFDGLAADPIGHLSLSLEAFGWMTDETMPPCRKALPRPRRLDHRGRL